MLKYHRNQLQVKFYRKLAKCPPKSGSCRTSCRCFLRKQAAGRSLRRDFQAMLEAALGRAARELQRNLTGPACGFTFLGVGVVEGNSKGLVVVSVCGFWWLFLVVGRNILECLVVGLWFPKGFC